MKKNTKVIVPLVLIGVLSVFIILANSFNRGTENIDTNTNTDTEVDIEDELDEEVAGEILGSINEYVLMKENTLAVYESNIKDEYNYSIFNLYSDGSKMQRVIFANFADYPVEEVLEMREDGLYYINGTTKGTIFNNLLNLENRYDLILMREPLQVGTTWQSSLDSVTMVTNGSTLIETPVGSFLCIELTTNYEDGTFERIYYAKDFGLVQSISTSPDSVESIHTLVEFKENVVYEQEFLAFYYEPINDELVEEIVTMEISSTMNMVQNIEDALTNSADDELFSVLNGATINFIELYDDYVHIDLNNFDLINAGGSGESAMITGLVDSLCKYTNKQYAKLTVNGEYYNSQHLGLLEGLIETSIKK